MGCFQSTPLANGKKRKGAADKNVKSHPGNSAQKKKPSQTAAVTKKGSTPNAKKTNVAATNGKPQPPAPKHSKQPASSPNPLMFTHDDEHPQRDRLSSITSSSASVREQLLAAQAAVEAKQQVQSDHVPLSDGKIKNLRVWIDSTEKKSLLDPQDFAGLQRREREASTNGQLNKVASTGSNLKKRMSILLSFTEIENSGTRDETRTDASVAVAHDSRSTSNDL